MKKMLVAAIAACTVAFVGSVSAAGPILAPAMKPGVDQAQSANSGIVLVKKRPGAGHRPHRPNRPNRHRRAGAVAAGIAVGVAIGTAATASRRNYCSRLAYRCNRGDLLACGEHDFNCLF